MFIFILKDRKHDSDLFVALLFYDNIFSEKDNFGEERMFSMIYFEKAF
jgi:hypothetical protein